LVCPNGSKNLIKEAKGQGKAVTREMGFKVLSWLWLRELLHPIGCLTWALSIFWKTLLQ
jgi:hypothetical protein